jgi:hypothetical protein
MHKSQGFGSTGTRGSDKEYIELIKGDEIPEGSNVFEGINTSWTRIKGGKEIEDILMKAEKDFDFRDPSKSVPLLIEAYNLILKLEDNHWKEFKSSQIKEIIASCMGLYLEAVADESTATVNQPVSINIEAINRSNQNISLEKVTLLPEGKTIMVDRNLSNNESYKLDQELMIPKTTKMTSPYWLTEKGSLGMYKVDDKSLIGNPATLRELKVAFTLNFKGTPLEYVKDIVYKYNDPVKGEVYQPFEIVPEVASEIKSKVVIFNEFMPKSIPVSIKAYRDSLHGSIALDVPNGWKVEPSEIDVELWNKGEETTVSFMVTPPQAQSEGTVTSIVKVNGKNYDKTLVEINYDHIPKQSVLLPAESKFVRLNLVRKGQSIAYIKGAGDEVPKYLKQIGYAVTEIDPNSITQKSLSSYDAVILGIRAYNTVPELKLKQDIILDYVHKGGNVIVQYNTSHNLVVEDNLAPYALKISRDRITDENAKVTFLAKDHEIMNYPNKIVPEDFDGWVQERGLYFPDEWGDEFSPILSFEENGGGPMDGSLLVARYGKGHYIYTGLSFFRELPAGVPGAYKLFTNMISLGKNDFETELKK